MKKKITEMYEIAKSLGDEVINTIISNNIGDEKIRDLKTEQYRLEQSIELFISNLCYLNEKIKTNYILKNKYNYVIGFDFIRYFNHFVRTYKRHKVDAQNFLNKVAQARNNNNQ